MCFRQRRLKVEITHDGACYSLLEGGPLQIAHHGEAVHVTAGQPVTRTIPVAPAREVPTQPPGRAPARRRLAG
jgi:alpha,alpha-trehalose phosphorylase